MMNVRTRFAPSPTGFIHLGNVWVAFLNWLYTRQHQGKLVLRIEDIDQTRSRKEYAQALMEDLDWLGLDWDGDAVSQF
ncbi:glutamate--tRNA ligase family protein, partial [Allisonella histaminiformans]|uniref:glutamate--tRNA ligase family protein n=1 Tax=Allisonella histaminiformans TaxID=209880 RepID=UPI002A81E45D